MKFPRTPVAPTGLYAHNLSIPGPRGRGKLMSRSCAPPRAGDAANTTRSTWTGGGVPSRNLDEVTEQMDDGHTQDRCLGDKTAVATSHMSSYLCPHLAVFPWQLLNSVSQHLQLANGQQDSIYRRVFWGLGEAETKPDTARKVISQHLRHQCPHQMLAVIHSRVNLVPNIEAE